MMRSNEKISFGISSWSYPWACQDGLKNSTRKKLSAPELLLKARDLDVRIVQIADNLPLEKLSKAELSELREVAQQWEISIEVGTKGIQKDHLLRFLEITDYLGSNILRTLPAIFGKRIDIDEIEENLIHVLPSFENSGVMVVLENQEAYKADELANLIRRINHPNLSICLDLANALGAMEDPKYVMGQLGYFCGNFHFKDVKFVRSETLMGFSVVGCPSGQGQIPIHWALDKLKHYGCFPNVILELWPPFLGTIDATLEQEEKWVKESVNFLNTLHW